MANNVLISAKKALFRPEPSEQEQQAEALFTSIGEGAISTDEFGRITRINPVGRQLLGYRDKELIGAWFPKIITAIKFDESPITLIDRPITKAFLTGKPVSDKVYYVTKNGKLLPVAVTASPVLLVGKPVGAIVVFRDITLEQEVDRMKSEFISLASHQLRTPLSAVKTYTHMMADGMMGELTDTQQKALDTIISAANRMNELISTLLNITRIESGAITVSVKQLNINAIIKEVVEESALAARRREVKLTFEAPRSRPIVINSDGLITKEVITNLVTNAIKYTPSGGEVTVKLKSRRADVMIMVIDSGWGIPLYSQSQIFSKFFRAHNIAKRETSGIGLGLYLVKGLLEAIGGRVWFKSKEGSGTTFYITLPRKMPLNLVTPPPNELNSA